MDERRLLQLAVAAASLVPLAAGLAGILEGPGMVGAAHLQPLQDLDSHFRYLSGLLLGIGLCFLFAIPTIERRTELFTALGAVVVVGGLARLGAALAYGFPGVVHSLALVMELAVVPALILWQRRVAAVGR